MSKSEYDKIPKPDPFINKKILNEIIPKELAKLTQLDDQAFSKLLNIQLEAKAYDYEQGIYEALPKDPRG